MKRHAAPTVRYQMRAKIASIGDDSWIEDDEGHKSFKVNGKAMRLRDTFVLEDVEGNEVAKIQQPKLHVRATMAIERAGRRSPPCIAGSSGAGTISRSRSREAPT